MVGPVEGTALGAVLAAQDAAACISYSWSSVRWTSAQVDVFSAAGGHSAPGTNKGNENGSGNRQVVQRRKGFRLHRTGRRRRGRLRPLLRHPVRRLQVTRREPEGRVRRHHWPQ